MNLWSQLWGGLPLLVFVCLMLAGRWGGLAWWDALLRTIPWWAAIVWGMANLLSGYNLLTPGGIRIAWVLVGLGAAAYAVVKRRSRWSVAKGASEPLSPFEWMVWCGVGVLVLLALITAAVAPPVTVDVLNYHAPRQLLWLQQGSLAHFITVNDRQLMMPPLSEIIGLQFLALTGSDYWANLPQWFAYALLPVTVAATVRTLGASRASAALAAWLAACLPMAYLEASNGKNDLQGALWIALLFLEVARARTAGRDGNRSMVLRVGLVLGLAMLTKSTSLVFAPPLIVAGVWAWARARQWRAARMVVVTASIAVLITAPFFMRNLNWYGTPLGVHRAEDGGQQANTAFTPGIVVSNVIRDTAQHLAGPAWWNRDLEDAVKRVHGWMGVLVSDPRSTCWVTTFALVYGPTQETLAGAPWHFVLIVITVFMVLSWARMKDWRWLAWVCVTMGLGYCIAVKWQPWAPRLQQPAFVVGIILVAAAVDLLPKRIRSGTMWAVALLGLGAWWPSREADARPLWTEPTIFTTERETMSYRYLRYLQERDTALAEIVRVSGVRDVMMVSVHDIPYLVMRRLQRESPTVHFHGAPASDAAHDPDAILPLELLHPLGLYHQLANGVRYRLVGDSVGDGIYLQESRVHELGWVNRLPAFAGWTSHVGLAFRVNETGVNGGPKAWREMSDRHAELCFPGWGVPLRLDASVIKRTVGRDSLELVINGRVLQRIELPEYAAEVGFSVWLPVVNGSNRLELRRPDEAAGSLQFTRITLNDKGDVR